MIGNMRWNLWMGAAGFALTFSTSLSNNIFMTTVVRSLYGFLILFLIAFVLRWLLGTVVGLRQMEEAPERQEHVGQTVDLTTPQENDLQDVIRQHIGAAPNQASDPEGEPFKPLSPPKLVSNLQERDAADLAHAVRRLTDE